MEKNHSISITLNGEALIKAKECHEILDDKLGIRFVKDKFVSPHINLMSGKTSEIEKIINELRFFNIKPDNTSQLLGLGVLMNKSPLLYMRFTNSVAIQNLRKYIYKNTKLLWTEVDIFTQEALWIPKCTIAYKDILKNHISGALEELSGIDMNCKMLINQLSIIDFSD